MELTVSPSVTVTAPLACLPMWPVSTKICKDPKQKLDIYTNKHYSATLSYKHVHQMTRILNTVENPIKRAFLKKQNLYFTRIEGSLM